MIRVHRAPGALLLLLACSRPEPNTVRLPENPAVRRGDDPPVAVNPETPVEFPPALFARGIEGKVILRLFVDEAGRLSPESTRVAESSGYPALDSAALAAVGRFRFAPALRNGSGFAFRPQPDAAQRISNTRAADTTPSNLRLISS